MGWSQRPKEQSWTGLGRSPPSRAVCVWGAHSVQIVCAGLSGRREAAPGAVKKSLRSQDEGQKQLLGEGWEAAAACGGVWGGWGRGPSLPHGPSYPFLSRAASPPAWPEGAGSPPCILSFRRGQVRGSETKCGRCPPAEPRGPCAASSGVWAGGWAAGA